MRLELVIDSTNEGCGTREDLSYLLGKVAQKVHINNGGSIMDVNGNTVGHWEISEEEDYESSPNGDECEDVGECEEDCDVCYSCGGCGHM